MRKVVCLTTEEQVSGIHHADMAEVHIIVDIDDTTDMGIVVVGRLGVGELTEDGKQSLGGLSLQETELVENQ